MFALVVRFDLRPGADPGFDELVAELLPMVLISFETVLATLESEVEDLKALHFQAAEAEYTKRLRLYCTLDLREVKDEPALLGDLVVLDEQLGALAGALH